MKFIVKVTTIILLLFSNQKLFGLNDSTFVEFGISADKNYQADKLILKLSIESENKSFSIASEKCNNLINNIKSQLDSLILKSKIEFNIHNYNSFPVSTFFKDYYQVTANIDVIIKDKEALGIILERIKNYEEIKIKSVDFKYMDHNDIQNELIKEISLIAEKKVKVFEESFHVKLELFSIKDSYYSNDQIRNYGIDASNLYTGGFGSGIGKYYNSSESSFEVLNLYPEQKFNYTLYFRYKIIK
jgi:uncharacterized protein YggE